VFGFLQPCRQTTTLLRPLAKLVPTTRHCTRRPEVTPKLVTQKRLIRSISRFVPSIMATVCGTGLLLFDCC
jgi:hypothetical protein